jgi:hypothetical protein
MKYLMKKDENQLSSVLIHHDLVFGMRMARLELARQSHTPLKRARIPIPPHPQDLSGYSAIAL